ncbi:MAG TPA: hypothetical protein VFD73_06320, partial [Gemmatimonadales bacterium]|nr:hypothetical protein [Gemmatimonadales bacterium]
RVIGIPGRELMAVRRDGSEFPIDLSVSSFASSGGRRLIRIPGNDDGSSYLQTEVDGRVRRSEKRHAFSGTVLHNVGQA